jgi:hypothetical protein
MTWSRVLLVPLLLAGLASPAPAGFGLFGKKPKANPAERVPELLIQLKSSPDESQRAAAADELRQYDPKAYPEIMTGLIDALGRDASPAVRAEVAESLGRLRPVTQKAGYALEQALANDGSMRVRMSARSALWQYNLFGYRSGKPADNPANGAGPDTGMAAPPGPSTPATAMRRPPATARAGHVQQAPFRETPEPPLADPVPPMIAVGDRSTGQVPATPAARPQSGLPPAKLIPVNPPRLQPVPAAPASRQRPAAPNADGPALPPPG